MDEKFPSQTVHVDDAIRKNSVVVKEANVRSAVLTAAHEAQKPNLLSKNMIKLYAIMVRLSLISTETLADCIHLGHWVSGIYVERL